MIRGWFIGDFKPTVFKTKSAEVAVKRYKAGDYEDWHVHKIATEITMIVEGEVEMNGNVYCKDDIILIEPNEGSDFRVIKDTINVVVKIPAVSGDKYLKKEI